MTDDLEYITVDPQGGGGWSHPMPFRRIYCPCRPEGYLVCVAMPWGRCGNCGMKPE